MNNKRNKIFKSALKLFTSQGFHGTPTSQIAKDAGVATGTLFHYFKTKEELINCLYLECKDNLIKSMLLNLDKTMDFKDKIKDLWFKIIYWGINNKLEYLFFQQFSNSPFITKYTKEEGENKFSFLYTIIEDAKKNKLIKNISTELIIDITSGLIFIVIGNLIKNKSKLNDKKYLDDAFNVFYDSIKI